MRLITKNKIVYRCQAGKNKFSITADGDIYPCDSFVGMKGMKIGNVYYDEVNEEVNVYYDEVNEEVLQYFKKEYCMGS